MKQLTNLSKRAKILLAIVGVLVVITVGVVATQLPTGMLAGAAILSINPNNPSVRVGITTGLTVMSPECTFTSSNVAIASLGNITYGTNYTAVGVTGVKVGQATITAQCAGGTATTTVTVVASPPTATPTRTSTPTATPTRGYSTPTPVGIQTGAAPTHVYVAVTGIVTLSAPDPTCTWRIANTTDPIAFIGSARTGTVTIQGTGPGQGNLITTCPNGTYYGTIVTVTIPAITPANSSIKRGTTIRMDAGIRYHDCVWSASIPNNVSIWASQMLTPDGPQHGYYADVTGLVVGKVTISTTCDIGSFSTTLNVIP